MSNEHCRTIAKLVDFVTRRERYFCAPEWAEDLRQPIHDLKAGNVECFESVEELLADLHRG
jgi:hypothetical protein